jgi:hypothetical protein
VTAAVGQIKAAGRTRRQAKPHRLGIDRALGLRARSDDVFILIADRGGRPMVSTSLTRTVSARRKTSRLRFVPRLQRLEDRTDPSSFATPLLPEEASGGLIYDCTVDGSVVVPAETDTYTLSLDGGQTVALVAHPAAAGLQLTVRLSGPGDTVLAAATAAAQGADAVVQAVPVHDAVTYTFTVSGASATTGGNTSIVAAVLLGMAWWLSIDRLSAEEHLLVGKWTFDGTSRTRRIEMQFLPDRQCYIGFGRPSHITACYWFVRNGDLVLDGEPNAVRRVLRLVLSGLGYPSNPPDNYGLESITARELVLVMSDGTRDTWTRKPAD